MGPGLGAKKKGLKMGTGFNIDLKPKRLKTSIILNYHSKIRGVNIQFYSFWILEDV